MASALAKFRDGLVVEVKPPRMSKARRDRLTASVLALLTPDDEGHWRFDASEPRPACRAGVAMVEGQLISLRWFIWAAHNGPIPDDSSLRSLCGGSTETNPCYNPEHFYTLAHGEPAAYCRRGHLFTDETLHVDPVKGTRRCLVCRPLKS